jgi:hypothetical protein
MSGMFHSLAHDTTPDDHAVPVLAVEAGPVFGGPASHLLSSRYHGILCALQCTKSRLAQQTSCQVVQIWLFA